MASWDGGNYDSPPNSGSATNGLGETATNNISQSTGERINYWHGSGSCASKRFTVRQNPGVSFDIRCSPYAHAPAALSPPTSYATTVARVAYRARAVPVLINLAGATDADTANPKVLTGQGVQATLSAGVFAVASNSHNWSVTGDIFKNYENGAVGEVVPFEATDYTQTFFHFFTKDDDTITVTCSAEVITPSGNLPVTIVSYPLRSLKPTVTKWDITTGRIRILRNYFGLQGNSDVAYPISVQGQYWVANVAVPAPFSGGQWCFTQLCVLKHESYPQTPPPPRYINPFYNTEVLDLNFTYPDASKLFNVGQEGRTGDDPTIGINSLVNHVVCNDNFKTWIMFKPEGTDTAWVPIEMYTWSWSGSATSTGVTSATYPTPPMRQMTSQHPTWIDVNKNAPLVADTGAP